MLAALTSLVPASVRRRLRELLRLGMRSSLGLRPENFQRQSYSQFGEDIALEYIFREKSRGVYVDVGCYHPIRISNTYLLHRRGWRGINVDATLDDDLFGRARPHDENVRAAVSDTPEELTLYRFGDMSGLNTLDPIVAEEWRKRFKRPYVEERVRTRSLQDIFETSRFASGDIDLLSIDVEGHELSVLRSLSFERNAPRVIAVELHESRLENVQRSELYRFLLSNGYELSYWTFPTLIFRHGEFLDSRTTDG